MGAIEAIMSLLVTDLPAIERPDGSWCTDEGETATYCTRCSAKRNDLQRVRQRLRLSPGGTA